jgi:outer membrane protein
MSRSQCRGFRLFLFVSLLAVSGPVAATAQDADGPPAPKDLEIRLGAGTLYAPAFLGAKQYQELAIPELKVTYKDAFFASEEDGIGYNIFSQDGWTAGPIGRVAFERPEDGRNPLFIGGTRTTALRGLGTVNTTFEGGAFIEYLWDSLSTRLELRKGIDGHEGVIGSISARYSGDLHDLFYTEGPPLIVAAGPHTSFADSRYEKAYFGVDGVQSAGSGLPRYTPNGGPLTYGADATLILPITYEIAATFLANYDRLAGDAAQSPLVRLRGSPDQTTIGLIVSYSFGYDTH